MKPYIQFTFNTDKEGFILKFNGVKEKVNQTDVNSAMDAIVSINPFTNIKIASKNVTSYEVI
ncbi:MAG: DUF2922 family protein [Lachnospirales bacterium]